MKNECNCEQSLRLKEEWKKAVDGAVDMTRARKAELKSLHDFINADLTGEYCPSVEDAITSAISIMWQQEQDISELSLECSNQSLIIDQQAKLIEQSDKETMTPEKYCEQANMTASSDYDAIKTRLERPEIIDLLHAAIGKCTEAGEALDALKKHIYYGTELDLVNIDEEIGDGQWYDALAMRAMNALGYAISYREIWARNIKKLRKRYGEKFSEYDATHRDLDAEREILEGEK